LSLIEKTSNMETLRRSFSYKIKFRKFLEKGFKINKF
jgi:hypothetical protein